MYVYIILFTCCLVHSLFNGCVSWIYALLIMFTNKHRWAGHVTWLKDNRWTKHVTEWCPQDHKWLKAHPKRHWLDDLEEAIGPNWSHVAKYRCCWTTSREGFLQQKWSKKPWWWWLCLLLSMLHRSINIWYMMQMAVITPFTHVTICS